MHFEYASALPCALDAEALARAVPRPVLATPGLAWCAQPAASSTAAAAGSHHRCLVMVCPYLSSRV
jgi:hypothetical protein